MGEQNGSKRMGTKDVYAAVQYIRLIIDAKEDERRERSEKEGARRKKIKEMISKRESKRKEKKRKG